jgi:hypothetical protein
MQLLDLIDKTIYIVFVDGGRRTRYPVKLLGVESGGIWVESQEVINAILSDANTPTAPKTPVVFLPYHRLSLVLSSIDVPSLNEKAFGV